MPRGFVPNKNLGRELAAESPYTDALEQEANRAAEAVRVIAPHVTGAYADSIEVVVEGQQVRLQTNDFAGHMVEWGSVNNPPYAPLRRGVRAAGLNLNEI